MLSMKTTLNIDDNLEFEASLKGKVIACRVDPDERTVTYFLEDYDEAKHGGVGPLPEGEDEEQTDEEVIADVVEQVAEANENAESTERSGASA